VGRALGLDLRVRVVEAIEAGLTHREAARRFAVGIATAGAWHRLWRRTGSVEPARQGHPVRSRLDPHEGFVLALVEREPDITLAEIAAQLAAEKGVTVCPSTVWHFFAKRDITFKKRPLTRPNRIARMSQGAGTPGSRASWSSIPIG
jgi:transposase